MSVGFPMEPMLSIVERALLLMEIDVFGDLSTEQVARIAAHTSERKLEAGENVQSLEKGMFYIIEGSIEFIVGGTVIRKFTKGSSFGLAALIGPDRAGQAEARAAEPSHLLHLPKEDFLDTVHDHPEVAVALLRRLSEMILDLLRQVEMLERKESVPIPGGMDAPEPARRDRD